MMDDGIYLEGCRRVSKISREVERLRSGMTISLAPVTVPWAEPEHKIQKVYSQMTWIHVLTSYFNAIGLLFSL